MEYTIIKQNSQDKSRLMVSHINVDPKDFDRVMQELNLKVGSNVVIFKGRHNPILTGEVR